MSHDEPDGRTLRDDFVNPDLYQGVEEGWNDVELYRMLVRQIQRSFHAGNDADRRTLLGNRPRLTGTKWDAVVAGVVEHVALTHGYTPPEWVGKCTLVAAGDAAAVAYGVLYEFADSDGAKLDRVAGVPHGRLPPMSPPASAS